MFQYEFLRDISLIWSLFHVLILFIAFYESRYPKKKTYILTGVFTGGLLVILSVLIFVKGAVWVSNAALVTCTLPSLVFFYLMSSQRDGRFVFTFCLVDTVSLWFIALTMVLNYWLTPDTYWVLFFGRLIGFPAFEYLAYRRLRKPYLEVQRAVAKGWFSFAAVTAVFYISLFVASLYPASIYENPNGIPILLLLLILMPLMYWNIFQVLMRQQRLADAEEEARILHLQSAMMAQRIERTTEAEKQISIHRHDLHHQLQAIKTMLENGEIREAQNYIDISHETLNGTKSRQWCLHPALDAVFSAYFQQAEAEGIKVEADIDIPADIPANAVELSTVFANALENAIHAVSDLPQEHRVIRCRCICQPQLMFYVANPYSGEVRFDENNRPVPDSTMHGIGTRSIAAYCEKYGAVCEYSAKDGMFIIRIAQTVWKE